MAEADDPFAEFEDWFTGLSPHWPSALDDGQRLPEQKRMIVQRNASLVMDRTRWQTKVDRFERAICSLAGVEAQAAKRKQFSVHFNFHDFGIDGGDFGFFHFPCQIDFSGARFRSDLVTFFGSEFASGGISFANADFGGANVIFIGAKFGTGNINLRGSKYQGSFVSFNNSVFGPGSISLISAQFSDAVFDFSGLQIEGNLLCRKLKAKSADFSETLVSGIVDWTNAQFGSIPDLRQTKLDRAPEVARMSVPAPAMVHIISEQEQQKRGLSKHDFWQLVAADGDDVLKLRKLKAMAIDANDHEKDGEFFAYEMMAKRGWETKGAFGLLANWLYWITSNYGRSYEVPFYWMVASFVGFATHYAWWLNRYVPMEDAGDFAFWFSLKNTVPFLGTLFRFVAEPENYTSQFDKVYSAAADAGLNVDALIHTGLFQGVLSLIFFFFLLLGLRNRFRLK